MRQYLQAAAMSAVDLFTAAVPRRLPDKNALRQCRIISHRGENDNREILENTMAAFEAARAAGVWAIECDIRWTRDLVPVIHHDPGCERLFGDPVKVASLGFSELRQRFPQIPALCELIEEFGGNTHLMLEIKGEHYPAPERQKAILQATLSSLEPGGDYHILLLAPELVNRVDFLPRSVCYLVAELNVARLSRYALENGFGGLTGHYLMLTENIRQRHMAAGQRIGTGFIHSRNALFRELNRGVDWIFSNQAVKVQGILDACRRQAEAQDQNLV
jgi:glycerophosphoryl diester phosphodiesterase